MMQRFYKTLLVFFLSAAFFISAEGQDKQKIDSLQNLLDKHPHRDTARVKLLLELATNIMTNDIDRSKKVIDEQIQISDSLKYKYGLAYGYMRLGYYYKIKGNDSLFLICTKKCLEYAEQIKNNYIKAVMLSNLGAHQILKLGNVDSALIYFNNAIACLNDTSLRSQEMLGQVLSNSGAIYLQQGDYKKALEYFLRAEKVMEASKSTTYLSGVYYNLSLIYSDELKNDKAAKEYAEKALKVSEKSNNKIGIAQGNDRLAALEKQPPKKRDYYKKAIAMYVQIGDKDGVSKELNMLGTTYAYSESGNNYDSAIYYFEKSLAQNTDDQTTLMDSHQFIGFGNYKKGNYEKALNHYLIALDISKKIQSTRTTKGIMADMIKVYAALNNYKKAFEYSQSYTAISDSLLDAEKVRSLDEMNAKYQSEKKEKEIALLTKDKEIQNIEIKKQTLLKNSLIGGLALVLVLFFFIYKNYRTRQKLKLESIRNNIAADLHDDIGSTLNSISLFSEVAKQEAGKPIAALDQIGVSARKIIDAMSDIVWTINPENDTFENVIARMRSLTYLLLKAKGIEFTFKADESLNQLSLPMPVRKNVYLLFKEAANNLVKYSNATRASFHVSLDNKNVKMIIRDNGVGFDMEQAQMGNGIKNMKRRAAEIGAQLLIESAEGKGTNIELSFKT